MERKAKKSNDDAASLGLRPVALVFDDAPPQMAMVDFLPRVGEVIELEDGRSLRVVAVTHQAIDGTFLTLMPQIHVRLCDQGPTGG